MPLTLVPPKAGRSPYYRVRGTVAGIRIDRTTGTCKKDSAKTICARWEREIARGEYSHSNEPEEQIAQPTSFRTAARAYMNAGGDGGFLIPLMDTVDKPLCEIDQVTIDNLATELYPNGSAATRNRQVYTPMIAVLRHAGVERRFKRPKDWRGNSSVSWLRPEQAFAIFAAADDANAEFGMFLRLLCYTGMRLSEALGVKIENVDLQRQTIYLPKTKNGDARTVYLTNELVVALANHPRGLDRYKGDRLIRFHNGGRLRDMLKMAMATAGLTFPRRQCGFHLFRHTWATWMRKFGGLDTSGLVSTGAWKDRSMAARYEHLDVSEEARRAEDLPTLKR